MKYDAETPTVVFLGPSLPVEEARSILRANYYPPAQMGDVYRLLATGVRLIVVIDGVFHASTPIWQREILSALEEGITVVGASSMGALRAAELEAYGMIGCGKVFEWYSSGVIEGDDEVAMFHTVPDFGYRAVSEPLVNMRHNLERARLVGILDSGQHGALVGHLKNLFYGQRCYETLFASDSFGSLTAGTQEALRTFLRTESEDLKQKDAIEALRLCATHREDLRDLAKPSLTPLEGVERVVEISMRGALTSVGELVPIQDALSQAARNGPATRAMVAEASRRFYLLRWMEDRSVPMPDTDAFSQQWCERHVHGALAEWLSANGLTAGEFEREIGERAAESWLLDQDPSLFGLPAIEEAGRPPALSRGDISAACYLNDWAQRAGIEIPSEDLDVYEAKASEAAATSSPDELTKTATAEWLVERTPSYFGYAWSADIALARELQMSGVVATSFVSRNPSCE